MLVDHGAGHGRRRRKGKGRGGARKKVPYAERTGNKWLHERAQRIVDARRAQNAAVPMSST